MASSLNRLEKALAVPPEEVEATTTPEPVSIADDAIAKDDLSVASARPSNAEDISYPSGLKLGLIITSLCLSMFLVSLVSMTIQSCSLGP